MPPVLAKDVEFKLHPGMSIVRSDARDAGFNSSVAMTALGISCDKRPAADLHLIDVSVSQGLDVQAVVPTRTEPLHLTAVPAP